MIKQQQTKDTLGGNDIKQYEYLPVKSIVEYEISRPEALDEENESKNDDKVMKMEKEEEEEKKIKIETNSGKCNNIVVGIKNITKAYRYGSDYVVVPPTLLEEMEYHAAPGLDIRGFATRSSLPRQYLSSESTMIIPDTRLGSKADIQSFNILVDVMLKHDKIAIARYVNKINGEVNMVCLCPLLVSNSGKVDIKHVMETRIMVLNVLPYMEDEKHMTFASLLNPHTSSGKMKREANDIDDDKLMQKFINSMDTDDIPSLDSSVFYKHYGEWNNKHDTSVPLPEDNNSTDELLNKDPTIQPHVTLHYKNVVLRKWIEEKYLSHDHTSDEFEVPQFPKSLKDKITPYVNIERPLTQEERDKIKETWKTQEGDLLTATNNQRNSNSSAYWLATELGPSQFDLD